MQSCIYEGQVRHTRKMPVLHKFKYRVFMVYLDLDELPTVFRGRWFWSASRAALARFRRADHIGDPDQPLAVSVRNLIEAETGSRPSGPIRLLTNLSYFGYCFNPVSFFYCFDDSGEQLEYIVAEVNNTPWGERKTYVLPVAESHDVNGSLRFSPKKKMHVSPFMPMDIDYDWVFSAPESKTNVFMANSRAGKRIFDASLILDRTEMTTGSMARVLLTFPFMTLRVVTAIYWQALRLFIKRVPLYAHPDKKKSMAATSR